MGVIGGIRNWFRPKHGPALMVNGEPTGGPLGPCRSGWRARAARPNLAMRSSDERSCDMLTDDEILTLRACLRPDCRRTFRNGDGPVTFTASPEAPGMWGL